MRERFQSKQLTKVDMYVINYALNIEKQEAAQALEAERVASAGEYDRLVQEARKQMQKQALRASRKAAEEEDYKRRVQQASLMEMQGHIQLNDRRQPEGKLWEHGVLKNPILFKS